MSLNLGLSGLQSYGSGSSGTSSSSSSSGGWLNSLGSGLQTGFTDLLSGASSLSSDVSGILGQNGTLTVGGTTIHTGVQPIQGATAYPVNYGGYTAGAASVLGSGFGSILSNPILLIGIIALIVLA